MEKELFDWEGWDGDMKCITFLPKSPIQLGDYPIGTKFDGAAIMQDKGILEFYKAGVKKDNYTPSEVAASFQLGLVVKGKI